MITNNSVWSVCNLFKTSANGTWAAYAAICLDMVSKIVEVKPDALASALDALEPHYDRLYGNKQWSDEAHQYFMEVVKNRNLDARAPFGY